MKIEKLLIGAILLIITSTRLLAQDYFIAKGDTTFCSDVEYKTNLFGHLYSLKYTDAKGQPVSIEDKQLLVDVVTFYQDSITLDRIPVKAHKPDKYSHFVERKVDGKLKVYLLEQGLSDMMTYNSRAGRYESGYIGPYIFILKMPDGTYYHIDHKPNMKNHIKPYLLQCPLFAQKYKGDFSNKQALFIDMVQLYNSLCE